MSNEVLSQNLTQAVQTLKLMTAAVADYNDLVTRAQEVRKVFGTLVFELRNHLPHLCERVPWYNGSFPVEAYRITSPDFADALCALPSEEPDVRIAFQTQGGTRVGLLRASHSVGDHPVVIVRLLHASENPTVGLEAINNSIRFLTSRLQIEGVDLNERFKELAAAASPPTSE